MKIFILVILLSIANFAHAQVKGKVINNGQPIEYLSVFIEDINVGTVTDNYGEFTLSSPKIIEGNTYSVTFSHIGYVTTTQELVAGNTQVISIEQNAEELDEIRITGYKRAPTVNNIRENSISKLPVLQKHQITNVNTVNLETLQEQRITSLSQAVNLVPGFSYEESRGNTFVKIKSRGYNVTQLYNGLRLESNIRSGEGNVNFNLIDNIEFVNGSSGIRYGNASPGGSINLNSKQAKLSNQGGALISYGSFNSFNVGVDKNFKINDKIGFRINCAFADGRQARILSDFNNYGFTPSLLFKPSDKDEIRVDYSYFHDARTPDRGNLVLNPTLALSEDNLVNKSLTNSFVGFKQDFQKENTHLGTVSYTRKLNNNWKLDARAGVYNRGRASRKLNTVRATKTDRKTGIYTSLTRASVAQEDASTTLSSAINLIAKDLNTGSVLHNLQIGADVWDNNNSITGYNAPDRRNRFSTRDPGEKIDVIDYTNPDFSNTDIEKMAQEQKDAYYFKNLNARSANYKTIYGIVAQDQLVFFDKLRLTLGGRYATGKTYSKSIDQLETADETTDQSDTQTFTGWSYNTGLFYDIDPNVTVFSSYANTFDESSVSASRVDINGEMIPNEVIDQYEIGVRTTLFDNLLSANLNVFYMINNDVAIRAVDADGEPLVSENAKPQNPDGFYYLRANAEYRKGAELFLQGNITPQWTLLGSYTYFQYELEPAEGEDLEAFLVNGQPKHSGSIWSKYEINNGPLKGFSVGAGAQIIGDRQIGRTGTLTINPSYTKIDAIVGYKFDNNFFLTAKFNNITNQVAYDAFRQLIVNPIQPFNFDIRLNYNF